MSVEVIAHKIRKSGDKQKGNNVNTKHLRTGVGIFGQFFTVVGGLSHILKDHLGLLVKFRV